MHLLVFSYDRRYGLSKHDYMDALNKIDLAKIKSIAPSATLYSSQGGSTHEYAKICKAVGNNLEHSIFIDVVNDDEALALINDRKNIVINKNNYYWYAVVLRYAYKDIDYDALAPLCIMELLSDQDSKAIEKSQRANRLKKVSKVKRDLQRLAERARYSGVDLSTETFDLLDQASDQIDLDHASIKAETVAERKEADKNKASLRAKLSKFVVYNSNSKTKNA